MLLQNSGRTDHREPGAANRRPRRDYVSCAMRLRRAGTRAGQPRGCDCGVGSSLAKQTIAVTVLMISFFPQNIFSPVLRLVGFVGRRGRNALRTWTEYTAENKTATEDFRENRIELAEARAARGKCTYPARAAGKFILSAASIWLRHGIGLFHCNCFAVVFAGIAKVVFALAIRLAILFQPQPFKILKNRILRQSGQKMENLARWLIFNATRQRGFAELRGGFYCVRGRCWAIP